MDSRQAGRDEDGAVLPYLVNLRLVAVALQVDERLHSRRRKTWWLPRVRSSNPTWHKSARRASKPTFASERPPRIWARSLPWRPMWERTPRAPDRHTAHRYGRGSAEPSPGPRRSPPNARVQLRNGPHGSLAIRGAPVRFVSCDDLMFPESSGCAVRSSIPSPGGSMLHSGIDPHKGTVVVSTVDAGGRPIRDAQLPTKREAVTGYFSSLDGAATAQRAVVESTYNWYWLHDLLGAQGVDLRLAHSKHVKVRSTASSVSRAPATLCRIAGSCRARGTPAVAPDTSGRKMATAISGSPSPTPPSAPFSISPRSGPFTARSVGENSPWSRAPSSPRSSRGSCTTCSRSRRTSTAPSKASR